MLLIALLHKAVGIADPYVRGERHHRESPSHYLKGNEFALAMTFTCDCMRDGGWK